MSQTINFFGVAAKALEKKFCFIEHPGQRGEKNARPFLIKGLKIILP